MNTAPDRAASEARQLCAQLRMMGSPTIGEHLGQRQNGTILWEQDGWPSIEAKIAQALRAAYGSAVHETSPGEMPALRSNLSDSWAALRMIREAVETLGPVGAMPSEEHVACAVAPTHLAEAEAIVAGITRIADKPCRRCGSRSIMEPSTRPRAETPCCWCDGTGFGPDREECPHCEARVTAPAASVADQVRQQLASAREWLRLVVDQFGIDTAETILTVTAHRADGADPVARISLEDSLKHIDAALGRGESAGG